MVIIRGGGTAKANVETPILAELEAIKGHSVNQHVILIDDVRCFGTGDYPTIDEVKREIKAMNAGYRIIIADDILSAEPF